MKNILKISLAVTAMFLLCSASVSAQKFAFIDSNALIQSMPEIDSVSAKMTALQKELGETHEFMVVEFNNKLNDLSANLNTMTESVRQIREEELNGLRERIERFQNEAPQQLEAKRMELMTPVIEKAREAIQKVAKAGGYTAVFDLAAGSLVYHDEAAMTNLLSSVQRELGVQPR